MIRIKQDRKSAILEALSSGKPMRYADIRDISRSYAIIQELVDEGLIERIGRGLYAKPGRDTSWDALAMLAARHPDAVVCLASAAAFHGLTTQNPHEVWAAFAYGKATPPKSPDLTVKGFRWRGPSMEIGIQRVDVGGTPVLITSPARTVVDLIRTKGRSGEDEVAMEALRNFVSQGRAADLLKIASKLGCVSTIRPYAEAAQGFKEALR